MSESQATSEAPTAVIHTPKTRRSPEAKDRKKPKRQPPYAVVVHNDEDHTFPYVIEVLRKICAHPLEKATQLTSQVHFLGCAIVWTGTLELAELKRDQIRGFGTDFFAQRPVKYPLGVTVEPLPGD